MAVSAGATFCVDCGHPRNRQFHTGSGACKQPRPGACPKCGHPLDVHKHSPSGGGDLCGECQNGSGCNYHRPDPFMEELRRDHLSKRGINPDNPYASDLHLEQLGVGTSPRLAMSGGGNAIRPSGA